MTGLPRPAVAAPAAWSFPRPKCFVLANGLQVQLYHLPGQYVVSAGIALDVPLAAEPRDREGVAGLVAVTLDQGTRSHPGTAFADAVERCGAVLQGSIHHGGTQVYLDVPGSRLPDALPLLAEALREPDLLDADVVRERAITLADIEQQLATSAGRADQVLQSAIVDQRFRSSRLRRGEPATLRTVTGDDVRAFHAERYGPQGATLVLAGDFPHDPTALVEETFGGWDNPGRRPATHEVPGPGPRRLLLVDRPGSVQADVRMARFTIDRGDPRWADLQIAAYALGGAFLSRLNSVLREEKGYTYGVHAVTAPLRSGGYTTVSGSFRNDAVADAVATIPGLLDVNDRPLTAREVDAARTYLAGVQPLQYATASGICNGVMSLLTAGLGPDFVDRLRTAYQQVTPESATRVAADLLPPADLSLVVVGDAGVLAGPLGDHGFDVTVVAAAREG